MNGPLPRMLLIVRAGRNSLHRAWSWSARSVVDILLSTYDGADWSGADAHYFHVSTAAGKFPSIKQFFEQNTQFIGQYDYFWLLDDDIYIPDDSLKKILELLRDFGFVLAQPALSYYSFFSWPITVRNDQLLFRGTQFIEAMAPIMSRRFLELALPHFGENFSGWGHEWLWRHFLEQHATFAAVIDAAPIVHTRPLGTGPLYRERPADVPDAAEEMEQLLAKFGLDRAVPFRNLFGITAGPEPRLLYGDDLLSAMLSGYREMIGHDIGAVFRCIDDLLKGGRPLITRRELSQFAGFDAMAAPFERG